MSISNKEKMKKVIADKKAKGVYLQYQDKIGSGTVEAGNKSQGNMLTRTKKIGQ